MCEQKLQQKGWAAVVANLETIARYCYMADKECFLKIVLCFSAFFKTCKLWSSKSHVKFLFFATVKHLCGPPRKQKFTSTSPKVHCLWFVIGEFQSILSVSVFQGITFVWLTVAKNVLYCKLGFECCIFFIATVSLGQDQAVFIKSTRSFLIQGQDI